MGFNKKIFVCSLINYQSLIFTETKSCKIHPIKLADKAKINNQDSKPFIPSLCQARSGLFYDCTSTAIIPALVDGGLVFILRWALDDSTENTMAAAVSCLHSLLVCLQDEVGEMPLSSLSLSHWLNVYKFCYVSC